MSAHVSEAFVLRTYPLREADLIASFFTRDHGKLRGVARRARKPGNRFGSGLERLSYVRMFYFHRENRDLDTLDACELVRSRYSLGAEWDVSVALDYVAEICDHILPASEPNERFFRLLIAVTDYLRSVGKDGVWPAVNYFTLWAIRLNGFLAPVEINEHDRLLAEEMLRSPLPALAARQWSRETALGLRRRLIAQIEEHIERRLVTVGFLEDLG